MKILDALPTITSLPELEGFLDQGRVMKFQYSEDERAAIALRKIQLQKGISKWDKELMQPESLDRNTRPYSIISKTNY